MPSCHPAHTCQSATRPHPFLLYQLTPDRMDSHSPMSTNNTEMKVNTTNRSHSLPNAREHGEHVAIQSTYTHMYICNGPFSTEMCAAMQCRNRTANWCFHEPCLVGQHLHYHDGAACVSRRIRLTSQSPLTFMLAIIMHTLKQLVLELDQI